ncbi:MAG: NUDIX domain-containing protein [Actinobacteria bacterium]|nr:MAG: NUDIX domain-containing protein [Actinomycetota bacterium]
MSTDAERRGPRNREFSAGGVVVRGDDTIVIIPVRRAASGRAVVALPKGHIDPGETSIEAAAREVREEAGVDAEPVEKLGDVRYWYQRSGRRIAKQVAFFLCEYRSGDPADHDSEVEIARWMPLAEAARELSYKGEREMVERALERVRR